MIDITIDSKKFERASKLLQGVPEGLEKATVNALNRTLTAARAEAVREIGKSYDMKSKTIRDTMSIQKANMNTLSGSVISRGSPIPLINFKVNPKTPNPKRKKQTFASVKKSGAFLKGAFVQQMPNGNIGVYQRIGRRRLPIRQLYGPAVPQMMKEDGVMDAIQRKAQETVIERLEHETIRLLGRY